MANSSKNKLFLFDIDGTLITTGGAGSRAMNLAFEYLFGIRDAFRHIKMAGKTDIQIMKEGMSTHGISMNHGNLEKMKEMYLHYLAREINNPHKGPKSGVIETLNKLKDTGHTIGLLTGNLREGARIKLGACGIYHYFIDGAFGSDHEDRDALLPIAIEKFRRRGYEFSIDDCVIVGDTPRDVRCAKVHNAFCIAVATGPYSLEELRASGADVVIPTLETDITTLL